MVPEIKWNVKAKVETKEKNYGKQKKRGLEEEWMYFVIKGRRVELVKGTSGPTNQYPFVKETSGEKEK